MEELLYNICIKNVFEKKHLNHVVCSRLNWLRNFNQMDLHYIINIINIFILIALIFIYISLLLCCDLWPILTQQCSDIYNPPRLVRIYFRFKYVGPHLLCGLITPSARVPLILYPSSFNATFALHSLLTNSYAKGSPITEASGAETGQTSTIGKWAWHFLKFCGCHLNDEMPHHPQHSAESVPPK